MNMQQLQKSIRSADEEILRLSGLIDQKVAEIDAQEMTCRRVEADNREKRRISAVLDMFSAVSIEDISSVNVPEEKYESIKRSLEELVELVNSVKTYEDEQYSELRVLKEEKANQEKSVIQQQNLKTAYRLQLAVELERQQQEIDEARKLLEMGSQHDGGAMVQQ